MTERNRVTPFGEIAAIEQRGTLMGNRGSIHRDREIVRPWQVRRWISCTLTHKDWVAPKWEPRRWTALFFFDEAVALAAGHRPCALCRHADYVRWTDAWAAAFGGRQRADDMDRVLHTDRVDEHRRQRRHVRPWPSLPDGTYVAMDDRPMMVCGDGLAGWHADAHGYAIEAVRPTNGTVQVLTPRCTVEVMRQGYSPVLRWA